MENDQGGPLVALQGRHILLSCTRGEMRFATEVIRMAGPINIKGRSNRLSPSMLTFESHIPFGHHKGTNHYKRSILITIVNANWMELQAILVSLSSQLMDPAQ